ncbi:MAG: helix-turn-helix transcriptional regulator [Halobacteria archaeon]
MPRARYLGLVMLMAVAVVLGNAPAVSAAPGAPTEGFGSFANPLPNQQLDMEVNEVSLTIDIQEDGSAVWRMDYRIDLSGNRSAAFADLRKKMKRNDSYLETGFRDRINKTVSVARNEVLRPMRAENISVEAREKQVPEHHGLIRYSFDWKGFAEKQVGKERKLSTGEALRGMFLEEHSTLIISWPKGYTLKSVSPEPDKKREGAAVYQGPREFVSGRPKLTATSDSSNLTSILFGGLIVVTPILGGGFLARRGLTRWKSKEEKEDVDTIQDGTADKKDVAEDVEETMEKAELESDTEETRVSEPDPELMSNEERVLHKLRESGGRLKQKDLAEDLDWTAAKTSQVVGGMQEEGDIEKFRLGRENVLALPEASLKDEPIDGGDDDGDDTGNGGDGDDGYDFGGGAV